MLLSYEQFRILNESLAGPITLGLRTPTNMGLVSQFGTEHSFDEAKKKKMANDIEDIADRDKADDISSDDDDDDNDYDNDADHADVEDKDDDKVDDAMGKKDDDGDDDDNDGDDDDKKDAPKMFMKKKMKKDGAKKKLTKEEQEEAEWLARVEAMMAPEDANKKYWNGFGPYPGY